MVTYDIFVPPLGDPHGTPVKIFSAIPAELVVIYSTLFNSMGWSYTVVETPP